MVEHLRLIGITLMVLLMTSACKFGELPDPDEEGDARTYYESLNLETPEEAVQTFADAFQREDFMTVYLVLDVEAQKRLRMENAQTFNWRHLIGETADKALKNDIDFTRLLNIQISPWYFFDRIMLYAARKDDLLIDLRGDLTILRSKDSRTPDGEPAADVIASVDGVSGEVIFRVVTDGDARWRVYMVGAPGEGVYSWPATSLDKSP